MSIRYRLLQLFRALTAHPTLEERAVAAAVLSQAELRLFERMPQRDQRHCLDVYQLLVGGGYADPLLLRAALLHDCGKVDDNGRPIPLLYYGLFVMLKRVAPALYAWAARNGRGPLRPFATSSTLFEACVERISSWFFACAARAAPTSPSAWNAPALPIGHSTTGELNFAPNNSTDVSMRLTSMKRRVLSW